MMTDTVNDVDISDEMMGAAYPAPPGDELVSMKPITVRVLAEQMRMASSNSLRCL
jgi:hypothetical protein